MDKFKVKLYWISFALVLFLSLNLVGCVGVLTKTQLAEIKKFSAASNAYSEYPGAIIKAHSDLSFNNQLTHASNADDGNQAFRAIQKGFEKRDSYLKKSARADKACKILHSYSEILDKLSSDRYTEATQASLENFGSAMDNSIKEYNSITNSSLSLFGGIVAASLRGISSMYIKTKQQEAIKEAVTKADPMIEKIAKSIDGVLGLYAGPNSLEILKSERDDLQTWYEESGYKQPLATTQWVANEIESIDSAILLVDKSRKAAFKLRKAHATLLTKIEKKVDLKDSISIIEDLIDDVQAAKDLKDKVEGK